MITKSLAILSAVLGLFALQPAAQAHGRWGGGGFGRGGGGGWHGGGYGGFRPGGGLRPFGGARAFGARAFGPRPYGGMGGPYGGAPGGRPYGGYGGGYPPAYGGAPPYGGYGYGAARAAFGAGDWRAQQNAVRQAVREGRQVPLGQAIEAVRRRAPGHELDAGLETGPNGRPAYRVRWAGQDGRRQDYLVDAGTGAVIGPQGGRAGPGGQPPPWGGP